MITYMHSLQHIAYLLLAPFVCVLMVCMGSVDWFPELFATFFVSNASFNFTLVICYKYFLFWKNVVPEKEKIWPFLEPILKKYFVFLLHAKWLCLNMQFCASRPSPCLTKYPILWGWATKCICQFDAYM